MSPTALEEANQIRWDLGAFYSGLEDLRLDADMGSLDAMAKQFAENYKGKLAERLADAIRDYSEIEMLADKVTSYLALLESTDLANAAIKAKYADVQLRLSAIAGEYLTFFDLELVALTENVLRDWYERDQFAAKHRPWIEHKRVFKPHFLSESVESALTKRSPFGSTTWSDFFDEVVADLGFAFRGKTMNVTELTHVLTESKDADERAAAMECLNRGLSGAFAKYAAQTLYVVAGSKSVEDRERGYAHPMDARNKVNRIPDSAVETLHRTVTTVGGALARRYYKLKARHLGLARLRWSDRNAPMPFADTTVIPFSEAQEIVTQAYGSFSATLAGLVKGMFAERRIDAPALKQKRHGAFNSSHVLPGGKCVSYTLLNYLGSNNDVMTLAHELGHGVHGILAGEAQGALMFHAPIAYCETASIFGEMTTFSFLKERLTQAGEKGSLLALVMAKIDSTMNTVVRQIGLSNFERRLHGIDPCYRKWERAKKLSAEELNGVWLSTIKELYGEDGDVFTYENCDSLWSYIPHFHTPFYVYGYAFGELLTQGLLGQQQRLEKEFEPRYVELLQSGATKDVVGLLAPFGLDPGSEEFWKDGITSGLGKLIAEAEELSENVGVR
jgi:oligoendopeptidase F